MEVVNFGIDLVNEEADVERISVVMWLEHRFSVCLYDKDISSYFSKGGKAVRETSDSALWDQDTNRNLYDGEDSYKDIELPVYVQSDAYKLYSVLGSDRRANIDNVRKGVVVAFDIKTFEGLVRTRSRSRSIYFVLFCSKDEYTSKRLASDMSLDVNLYSICDPTSLGICTTYEYYGELTYGADFCVDWTYMYPYGAVNVFEYPEGRRMRKVVRALISEFLKTEKPLTAERYKNYYTHLVWFSCTEKFFNTLLRGDCEWHEGLGSESLKAMLKYNKDNEKLYDDCDDRFPDIGFMFNGYFYYEDLKSYEHYCYRACIKDFRESEQLYDNRKVTIHKIRSHKGVLFFRSDDMYFAIKPCGKVNINKAIYMIPLFGTDSGYILIYTEKGTRYQNMIPLRATNEGVKELKIKGVEDDSDSGLKIYCAGNQEELEMML